MLQQRHAALSAISGCIWAVVAYTLASGAMGQIIWGGILASPLIGVVVGIVFRWKTDSRPVMRCVLSLLSLYLGAALFGLASGIYDLVVFDHAHRIWSAVVLQSVLGTLWGVTFTGFFLVLWPLAYVNHWFLWHFAAED